MKIYKATKGAIFTDEQAQRYGERIEKLEEKTGSVTPYVLLEDAKKISSPLHEYFQWNDEKAAERYRVKQAGELLRSITVVSKIKGQPSQVQRAYLNVNNLDEKGRIYVNINKALTEPEYREQVLKQAFRELTYWEGKYQDYNELVTIFSAIGKTKKRFKFF